MSASKPLTKIDPVSGLAYTMAAFERAAAYWAEQHAWYDRCDDAGDNPYRHDVAMEGREVQARFAAVHPELAEPVWFPDHGPHSCAYCLAAVNNAAEVPTPIRGALTMSLWNAEGVDPDTVTAADLAEVAVGFGIDLDAAVPSGFFQPGGTYRRHGDTFRCAAVGRIDGAYPAAIGFLPVNLAGVRTWEMAMFDSRVTGGWKKVKN